MRLYRETDPLLCRKRHRGRSEEASNTSHSRGTRNVSPPEDSSVPAETGRVALLGARGPSDYGTPFWTKIRSLHFYSAILEAKMFAQRTSIPTPRSSIPTPRSSIPTPRSSITTPRSSIPTQRFSILITRSSAFLDLHTAILGLLSPSIAILDPHTAIFYLHTAILDPTPRSSITTPRSSIPTPRFSIPTAILRVPRSLHRDPRSLSPSIAILDVHASSSTEQSQNTICTPLSPPSIFIKTIAHVHAYCV